jgi:hypothetical protein
MKKILSYKIRIYSNNKAIREDIMSCYICDQKMFSYLASVIFELGKGDITRADAVNMGRVLYRENCRSYLNEYPNDKNSVNMDFPIVDENDVVSVELYYDEIFSAIECLEYQSCEHPEWKKSFSKKILDSILNSAREYPKRGYASWGVPDSFIPSGCCVVDI